MEITTKKQIFQNIGKAYEKAKDCKLEECFFSSLDSELTVLSQYFKTTEMQSFFIAVVFTTNYKGDTADLNNLSEYFNCNPLRLLEFQENRDTLCKRGIFHNQKSTRRLKLSAAGIQYTVEEKVSEAIMHGLVIPDLKKEKASNITYLLEEIYLLGWQRNEEKISTLDLFLELKMNYAQINPDNNRIEKAKYLVEKFKENHETLSSQNLLLLETIQHNVTIEI